jgi:hypothetical protein
MLYSFGEKKEQESSIRNSQIAYSSRAEIKCIPVWT